MHLWRQTRRDNKKKATVHAFPVPSRNWGKKHYVKYNKLYRAVKLTKPIFSVKAFYSLPGKIKLQFAIG
ncbi:MAG: hypothetical protein DRH32_01480 [Deltaproteobacteria bacterium]|nr:MAG: hypothetical protein DRH32_01480 [Deltaproteobacteria bacterium]